MVELVYHDPADRTGPSPFDQVLHDITQDSEAHLACPYITPSYLADLTEGANEWSLLTDVKEWLRIHGQSTRDALVKFLDDHADHIRYVPNLHAKVAIGNGQALIGSANFTVKGLTRRTEMAVHLDEQPVVEELTEWYEHVWSSYNPPDRAGIEAFLETAPAPPQSTASTPEVATTDASPGTASLVQSQASAVPNIPEGEKGHEKLVETVSQAPSPEWIASYFTLMEDVLATTRLSNDDSRLVMSLPENGTLPITINNRYVLVALRSGPERTEFILPNEQEVLEPYLDQAARSGQFHPIYDEPETETPWFVGYDGLPTEIVDDRFRNFWLSAVTGETSRATAAPRRKYHETVVYEAARDHEYRDTVIREAFADQ